MSGQTRPALSREEFTELVRERINALKPAAPKDA